MCKERIKILLSRLPVSLPILIFIIAFPFQANAYSIYGNVLAHTFGGETIDRTTNGGAATYLSDLASPSLGDGGTSAESAYFANLSTGLLGTYISGNNPFPEGITNASAEAMVSFQDALTFIIPAGTYASDLYVNANGFVNGYLSAFGCDGTLTGELCANVYQTWTFGFGTDSLGVQANETATYPDNSPNIFSENFTLTTRILTAGTYLTDQTAFASVGATLQGKGGTLGRFYPPPQGDSSSSFVADFYNTGGFTSLVAPDGVTWTSESGVFLSTVVPVPTFLASGWEVSDFLTLSSPTRSIAFDASNNLYIEDISDDNSGTIKILKLDAASGYSNPPSEFVLYATSYQGVNGLDFDGLGSLYVSEPSLSGDAGVIREVDVATQTLLGDVMTFANHRPTGIGADVFGNVFYTGRKASDGTFGNVYQIDSMGVRSILIDNIVGTGIAVDASGNIFVSTPGKTDLALLSNSIYMFRSSDASLSNPVLIATFNVTGGELTFDDDGSLYMIANDKISIIKLIPVDTDSDGLADYIDNCMLVSNSPQRDTDDDGYGNICDPDFNNDGIVASADLAFFKPKYFTADSDADLNGDGVVGAADLAILKTMFFKPPGPSGLLP